MGKTTTRDQLGNAPGGIRLISVQGFKSLARRTEVEIKPLTLLAGANSSGKSSAMQPLLLLKQTIEAPAEPAGALLLDGPNVTFTSAEQLFFRKAGEPSASSIIVEIHTDGSQSVELSYRKSKETGLDVVEMVYNTPDHPIRLRPGMKHEEIEPFVPDVFRALRESPSRPWKGRAEWRVERKRCFLGIALQPTEDRVKGFPLRIDTPAAFLVPQLKRIIHVPGLRGNPARTYRTASSGPEFPGRFEDYAASLVHRWRKTDAQRTSEVGQALEALGLTWKVDTKQVDDTRVEVLVGRLPHASRGGAKDMVNIVDAGFGLSQTLPVVVALLAAEPGQIVFLEQPEIHLHPLAQVGLADLLTRAANRGVRVIAETHSELLLTGVQALVAEGRLLAKDVALHWFERDEGGVTHVSRADLDETGAFGDWPEDFGTVTLNAQSRYMDAAERRRHAR